ncbi:MAG: PAS domain-containing protein, partial [Alphaproteobacteria bacterium]|nr:PAS domain-containing protein [Alphaproteobacteria bacterium]
MSYEYPTSPVAPPAGSRLWTAGAGAGVAIVVMLGLAILQPQSAQYLLAGAVLVGLSSWAVNRRTVRPAPGAPRPAPASESDSLLGDRTLLDSLFEALADPVLVVAGGEADDIGDRRVVLANTAARELLRIPREGALLVSALRDPAVLEAVDEALFGGVARSTDYGGVGAQARHWRALTRPLASDDGRTLALVVLRDETDVRRMELMRVDFLANASHELRTPLASLSGFIETLKGHARDDPKARDRFLDIMAAQADRMGRLVADLLSLSRIELNEHIPPEGRVDLARSVSDVVDAVSVLSAERGVRIIVPDRAVSAPVHGDRDEIVQVVQNLVDNAIKYSAAGDTIEIVIHPDTTLDQAAAP